MVEVPSPCLAEAADLQMRMWLRSAPPVTLHGDACWRADGNSPVRIGPDGVTIFFSAYQPQGHTLRRRSRHGLGIEEAPSAIRFIADPDPHAGKWLEAVWQDPAGFLRGWYHAEALAPGSGKLFLPHIGEAVSKDGGSIWRCCGPTLRAPPGEFDSSWQNGFFAGGYGDLCVVPDRVRRFLYLFFTSYRLDESAQGVAVARLAQRRQQGDGARLEVWSADGWQPADRPPRPIWPVVRGWRHADPDSFWGPAVHYNHALKAHVMLLNRTAGGAGDLVQEGIYASLNETIERPDGWSRPIKIVDGGAWYPQVVDVEEGGGDVEAPAVSRFFMGGFSAWEIGFGRPDRGKTVDRPLRPTKADFAQQFGAGRRCPW